MMNIHRLRSNQRGNIMIAFLWVTTLAVFLTSGFLPVVFTERRFQSRSDETMAALATAEAGAELAIWEFNANGGAFTAPSPWTDFTGTECGITWVVPAVCSTAPIPCRCRTYDVATTVTNPPVTTGTATILVKGFSGPTPMVESSGQPPGSGISTRIQVALQKNPGKKPGDRAIFSNGNITVSGGAGVTSYDGTDPQNPILCIRGGSPACVADVESNTGNLAVNGVGTDHGVIAGHAYIDGTINLAPYGDLDGGFSSQPTTNVTWPTPSDQTEPFGCSELGTLNVTTNQTYPTLLKPGPTYCADSITVGTNVGLTFSQNATLYVRNAVQLSGGGSIVWNGGPIRTGNFSMSSTGSQFEVKGETDFYVVGSVSVSSGADMNGHAPTSSAPYGRRTVNLRMYVKKNPAIDQNLTPDTVHFTSNSSENYLFLYAPDMPVTLDVSVDLHGAVIGDTVLLDANGMDLIYDISLKSVSDWPSWLTPGGGGAAGVSVTSRTRPSG